MVARFRIWQRLKLVAGAYCILAAAAFLIWISEPGGSGAFGRWLEGVRFLELRNLFWLMLIVGVLVLLLACVLLMIVETAAQEAVDRRLRVSGRSVRLLPGREQPDFNPKRTSLWSRIAAVIPGREFVVFEILGGEDGVTFHLRATEWTLRAVLTQIAAEYPGTRAVSLAGSVPGGHLKAAHIRTLALTPARRLAPIQPIEQDPIRALLVELGRLRPGRQGGLMIQIRRDPYTRQALRLAIFARGAGKKNRRPAEKKALKIMEQRTEDVFLECRLIAWASASSGRKAEQSVKRIAGAFRSQFANTNRILPGRMMSVHLKRDSFSLFSGRPWAARELTAVAHLIGGAGQSVAPALQLAPTRPLSPSASSRVPAGATKARWMTGGNSG